MENEYYGVASTPTEDYLAHYGIKGMKWGVRRARQSGNDRALARQYRKAEKKLAKLEKRAASGSKYAKRAARLGVGAAAAGGLAALGTKGVVDVMGHTVKGTRAAGNALMDVTRGHNGKIAKAVRGTGLAMIQTSRAGGGMHDSMAKGAKAITQWGNSNSIGQAMKVGGRNFVNNNGALVAKVTGGKGSKLIEQTDKLGKVSNNTIARIGAGAIGAGLAGAAGYNAYRAATTKRAAAKAAAFRKEMNKQFAGTKYANGGGQSKKRKRR